MNVSAVSEGSGVHKNLLYRLVNEGAAGYKTLYKLSEFFTAIDSGKDPLNGTSVQNPKELEEK